MACQPLARIVGLGLLRLVQRPLVAACRCPKGGPSLVGCPSQIPQPQVKATVSFIQGDLVERPFGKVDVYIAGFDVKCLHVFLMSTSMVLASNTHMCK